MSAPETAKRRLADTVVPMGVIGIVLMMVLPLPPQLLDLLLSASVALAIGIFLTALFIKDALEFSAFPALVLVATLLRLALNVATTRLILLHGNEGQGAAGNVVEAFGRFVVEGNVLVGLVVFLILAIINFVVVTRGAGRVAEVAARFTLDAMPGKQMAIDADLSSGAIAADDARTRRKNLEREADFYGAMDGASKFVHGDAIASLLITAVNLIGGLVLGIVNGMNVARAAETFSVLSVGDALASQIPALLISAASGIVVTRSATGDQLGRALHTQLFGSRSAMTLTAAIMAGLGLVPGLPALPCFAISISLFAAMRSTAASPAADKPEAQAPPKPKSAAEEIEAALGVDLLSLELGYELVNIVDGAHGSLLDRVAALRTQIARELGIVVPPVHVCDNLELAPGAYRVLLSGSPIGTATLKPQKLLAIAPSGPAAPIDGEATTDPTFGMPARWIAARDREIAEALGYTVVEPATVVATHLGELLRMHAHRLLGRQEAQHLVDVLARRAPRVVDDLIPAVLSLGEVLRVLRNLLREGVSIRDLRSVFEALADVAAQTKDPEQMTELVRERLAPQITSKLRGPDSNLVALALDADIEDMLRHSLRDIAAGTGGALAPDVLRRITTDAERAIAKFVAVGATPVLVAAPDLRRYARAIFERKLPALNVVSFREIEQSTPVRVIDTLSLHPRSQAA